MVVRVPLKFNSTRRLKQEFLHFNIEFDDLPSFPLDREILFSVG